MIAVENLSVKVGAFTVDGVSFAVEAGQYAVLMGRTGCGKTTLLEAVCGLKPVLAGRIVLAGRDVTGLPPAERGVGYVPQDLTLFPTMTVRDHLAFALTVRHWERVAVEFRVAELSGLLGLEKLLDRKPMGLSGGEAQRVALGRALSYRPDVLLLDEPLSALDEDTRTGLYELLRDVQQQTGVTALHVTHSRTEAKALADRLFRLDGGLLREVPDAGASALHGPTQDGGGHGHGRT